MRFNSLIPELIVSDFENSLDFYTRILGFKIEYERQENRFAFLSLQKNQIMIQQNNGNWQTGEMKYPYGRGINLQMEVLDVSILVDSLKKNKVTLFREIKDNWYRKDKKLLGNREFLVQDPDGYLLRFSEDLGTKYVTTS